MKKNLTITGLVLFVGLLVSAFVKSGAGADGDNVIILQDGVYFNGKAFVPFKEMVLKDGKIFSIGSADTKVAGRRIPVSGQYVIPGLIDAHVHISGSPAKPYVVADSKLNANSSLNCGVTTLVDLFYPEAGVKAMKEETGKSPELYSSLIMSGPILTAPGGHGTEYGIPTRTITSVDEAKKITAEVIDGGADVIKLVYEADARNYIPSITKDMMHAIVEVAHSRNKKVFAHIDNAAQAMDCAEAGADVLAHMPCDLLTEAQLKKLKSLGTIIIPTLVVTQAIAEGLDAKYMSDSLLWKTANPAYLEQFSHDAIPKNVAFAEAAHKYFPEFKWKENLANCIKAGIPILAGTDAGNYGVFFGYSLHRELQEYTKAGMTNADALCSATENIRRVLPNLKIGKIEVGYDADLVVLNEDPLKDIGNTESIRMVLHKGDIAKAIPMVKVVEAPQKAVPFDPAVLDFSKATQLPDNFSTYTDAMAGGSSAINAELTKDHYLHLSGKVVKKGYMGFAGTGIALDMNKQPVDINGYKAVEFDVKGNGETYIVSLVSNMVKDYNYHSATFTAGKNWQTVKISFDDLKQSPYGKQMTLQLRTITSLSFTASGKDMDIDLSIKNIHLMK